MTSVETRQKSLAGALEEAFSLFQAGDLAGAAAIYGNALESDPDNSAAMTSLGVVRLQQGLIEQGVRLLEQVLAGSPNDEVACGNLRQAYRILADKELSAGNHHAMIRWLRRLVSLGEPDPDISSNLEAFLAYNEIPAELSDYQPEIAPEDLGRTILIACMPKSGSSWLVNSMHALTGFPQAFLSNAYVENEQELYAPAIRYYASMDKIVHQHCRASAPTVHLVQAYGMHPVVLVRNLADTLVSMRDFWDAGAVRNSFFYGDWGALDHTAKHDALIRHLGPWYIQFYVSWKLAESKGDVAPLWVRYEEMIPEKQETLRRVAGFCGLEASDASIVEAIGASDGDRKTTRFNKGVAGRGAEAFTPAQLDTLRGLTAPFPSIDFSPIGL